MLPVNTGRKQVFGTGCMSYLSNNYGVIYADPPWFFKNYSPKGEGRNAVCHYPCMSPKDIAALPVADLAAQNSVLLLWAVDPLLPAAFDVIKAWGFKFKTVGFYWAKINRKANPHELSESDFRWACAEHLEGRKADPGSLRS